MFRKWRRSQLFQDWLSDYFEAAPPGRLAHSKKIRWVQLAQTWGSKVGKILFIASPFER